MDKIPFDPYDFFGYLASGVVVLMGMELLLGFPRVIGIEWKSVESMFVLLAAYVAGHIIATPAQALLEDVIVGKILKKPSVNLFNNTGLWAFKALFPGYYAALPVEIRERILAKARKEGIAGDGERLFLNVRYCREVLGNDKLMAKLDGWGNKYGFNRNLAFSSLALGVAFGTKAWATGDGDARKYAITLALVGILLFYRYLKFFRLYSFEMFNVYGAHD